MNLAKLLPKSSNSLGVYQLVLLTAVTLLVIIAATFSFIAFKVGTEWQTQLVGQYAIIITPSLDQNQTRQDIANKLDGLLKTDKEIKNHKIYQEDELESMISFWLGQDNFKNDLVIPLIAEIEPLNPDSFDAKSFVLKYQSQIKNLEIDDYGKFRSSLKKLAVEVKFVGLVFLIIVSLILITTIGVIVRGLFKVQENSLEIFHIFGASDQLLAKIVAKKIAKQLITAMIIAFILFSILLFVLFRPGQFVIDQETLKSLSFTLSIGLPIFLFLTAYIVYLIAYLESKRQISKWF